LSVSTGGPNQKRGGREEKGWHRGSLRMALLLAAFKLSVCHEETRVGHLSSGLAGGIGVLAQLVVPGSPVSATGSSTKANRFWNRLGFFIPS